MKLKALKLNKLANDELNTRCLNALKGGAGCTCACVCVGNACLGTDEEVMNYYNSDCPSDREASIEATTASNFFPNY